MNGGRASRFPLWPGSGVAELIMHIEPRGPDGKPAPRLIQADDFAAAESACAAGLARSQDAGHLYNLPDLLTPDSTAGPSGSPR
jgi:hypothetical protein